MNRNEIIEILSRIEREIDVQAIRYRDVQIWPLIKKDIFFSWFSTSKPYKGRKAGRFSLIIEIVKSSLTWFLLSAKLRKARYLFIGSASHRIILNDCFVNRYFINLNDKGSKYLSIDYGKRDKGKSYPEGVLFTEDYFPYLKLIARFKGKCNISGDIEGVKLRLKEIDSFDANAYLQRISNTLSNIDAYLTFFDKVISHTRPEIIYGLCYYKDEMFALYYIANKRQIINYDIQHGTQGDLHVMYNFTSFPSKGFNILPQRFWVWDDDSYKQLSDRIGNEHYHQVELKGNPWVDFCKKEYESRVEQLSDKRIILYTLQEDRLDEYILEAIRHTDERYEWWLRMHPRMASAKKNILNQLVYRGIDRYVELDKASNLPLVQVLLKSTIHISKYSGSIIEAYLLGCHSIIVDNIGVKSFAELIEKHEATVFLEEDANKLLDLIYRLDNYAENN